MKHMEVRLPNAAATVRAKMDAKGISLAEWARLNGYKIRTVRAVVRGELQGRRGKSHTIAVALGLKLTTSDSAQK